MLKTIKPDDLLDLLTQNLPLMDVRAPVEFAAGSIPGAVNLPILDDEERRIIGTTYKQSGPEAAVALGYQLVSGANKESKMKKWQSFLEQNPQAVIYCFRGGQRSQITQSWLSEQGLDFPIVQGGYKAIRQALIRVYENSTAYRHRLVTVVGPTGVGKTDFLYLAKEQVPILDLEGLAVHRGSAFGSIEDALQPSQIDFENGISLELLKIYKNEYNANSLDSKKSILVEDESRLIGRRALPEALLSSVKEAPVLWLEEDLSGRVENIFEKYILETSIGKWVTANGETHLLKEKAQARLDGYKVSLLSLQKRLGGLLCAEIISDLETATKRTFECGDNMQHKIWIEKLLVKYYDPMYQSSLDRRVPRVLFKGTKKEGLLYLKESVLS